ncbi:NAD(P)/FAD-dependent oxidoreductase [Luteimonas fraxinea]|uniref:NAD(P)/FAD-dependent oxidoreductase n=1 Tax=Luteimonas fraxinea TaxID=2901869 RepID=A0ABS8UG49_9GAMM|nr:NAD(P)/FAD-dependent oxidoreductase [Luteimonas fraxinea]MCD9098458.1 NAD(P)/FAD-dependent oxidoreductase [Luteimonas fraxinea]MCD9127191.1 NAD(P)/FAD-dependent oxidoreductase [Luteimonas fraxinea]UHH10569.1 NAD(P)/FAD-dependent oxidoreductase [Luteimonas fraxinea]
MLRLTDLKLPLDHDDAALPAAIIERLGIHADELTSFTVAKRSYDARRRGAIVLIYSVDVETPREADILQRLELDPEDAAAGEQGDGAVASGNGKVGASPDTSYRFVAHASDAMPLRPLVIGTGPCGLFAALVLAQMGFRPIVLERGKAVRERTVDTFGLWRKKVLNPESNVQFGEGGAGTFSDGKLYSQISDKRHHGRKVLTEFVAAGAPDEILYVSKPHIGTFRLVSMVEHMRATIESLGGEIRFSSRVDDLLVESDADGVRHVRGVTLADGEAIRSDHVVMALGHSARDTFAMLHTRGVFLEAKPFSIGFRIEHPQSLVDAARFGPQTGHPLLGAADYKLVHHARNGRSVYSFCMCPGGTVVAAASEPGRVVTNGMSQYSRNERNANAAIVVGITPEDYLPYAPEGGPLAGIALQRHWESNAFALGGGEYEAPGQLVGDLLAGRASSAFGSVVPSYTPGVRLGDLSGALPEYAITAIREALPAFDRQLRGFAMHDALLTGVETRTSSPLRITRHADGQSLNTRGLFPAGEGAGYAGGILSAGVDGIKAAESVAMAMVAAGHARAA